MTRVSVSSRPPDDWSEVCGRSELLFQGAEWAELLESSFGAQTQYLWDEDASYGAAISSFKAGPFRLGYLGFPCGGLVGSGIFDASIVGDWHALRAQLLPMAIRIPVSAFTGASTLPLPYVSNPETAIPDLQSWTLDATSGNHRRDIKKAIRSDLQVADASRAADASAVYQIYRDTLRRHRGGQRYNEIYFVNLIALARSNPQLRVLIARMDDQIAGYTVVVRHGRTAYYLHGGIEIRFRQHQPSALLLSEAIHWAKERGCESFNLMTSPPGQQTLVWYKEKWGAETREHRTYTLALRGSYRLFQIAESIYRLLP